MNNIPPELLAEVLREVNEEQGGPEKYDVPVQEPVSYTHLTLPTSDLV